MRYALKKIRRMRTYDIATGEHKVTLRDLKNFTLQNGQETVYAEGADGAKLAAFDQNKTSSVTAENGAVDTGYIEISVGDDEKVVANGTEVSIRESHVLANTTSFELKHIPRGATGNEVKFIYLADSQGNISKTFTQGASASAENFTYSLAGDDNKKPTITLPTSGVAVGNTIIVDYTPRFTTYKEISNEANKFSETVKVVLDAWFTDICTQADVPLQLVLPMGKVSGEMELAFGDNPAVQNVSIEAMTDTCGENATLWKLFTYDEEEIDDTTD